MVWLRIWELAVQVIFWIVMALIVIWYFFPLLELLYNAMSRF